MYAGISHPKGDNMHRITGYLFAAATLAAPVPAVAQSLSDHSPGRQVAMEICSSCHQVIEGQRPAVQNAPSFSAVANMPSTTALALKVFLASNHKRMPNFIISTSDTDAIIDYILSLKQR